MHRTPLLTLLSLLAIAAPAAAAEQNATLLVDRLPGALPSRDGIGRSEAARSQALSTDGRYVVFSSVSDDLSPADDDSVSNIYRRDRTTGTTQLVSVDAAGQPLHVNSYGPAISGDGTRVAFTTGAQLSEDDTDNHSDVYVRDLDSGAPPVLVNRADGHDGAKGEEGSGQPALDHDGSVVAFTTFSPLEDVDQDAADDVYKRDLNSGQTELVSRPSGAATASSDASHVGDPGISGDGSAVVFATRAGLSPSVDTNSEMDVYVRTGSTVVLASRPNGAGTTAAPSGAWEPSISADGLRVAFTTAANLGAGDVNQHIDVYVRRLDSDQTALASRRNGHGQVSGNGHSHAAAISADGDAVAFLSNASNLVAADNVPAQMAYVRDIDTGVTRLVSRVNGPAGAPAIDVVRYPVPDGDGSVVAFETSARNITNAALGEADQNGVFVRDGETLELVARPNGPATTPFRGGVNHARTSARAMSGDGRFVVFESDSDWLSTADDNRYTNVFLRDVATGEVKLLSRTTAGQPAFGSSSQAAISRDGQKVAFVTRAANLAPGAPAAAHVVVLDLASHTFEIADVATNGAVGDSWSSFPVLDADGSRVAFITRSHLHPEHFGAIELAYLRDLDTNTTMLVSRRHSGATVNGDVESLDLSDAGTRVAFGGLFSDAHPDAAGGYDVLVRNVTTNETLLASRPDDAQTPATWNGQFLGSISGNGRYVAFSTAAPNLVAEDTDDKGDVFVRDLKENRTRLASLSNGGAKGNADSWLGALSSTGRYVTFGSKASNLVPEVPLNEHGQVFQRDMTGGTTKLVSRGNGADGFGGDGALSGSPAVSTTAGCVVWTTKATNLVAGGFDSSELTHVFLRAVRGSCPV